MTEHIYRSEYRDLWELPHKIGPKWEKQEFQNAMSYIAKGFDRKRLSQTHIGGIHMISVKRPRKRSLINPKGQHAVLALAVLLVLAMAATAVGFAGWTHCGAKLDDLGGYMAKSIRADMNQALQCYDTLVRRGDDAADEALDGMKRYMYSAYGMNKLLVAAMGESYSLLDVTAYNNFQTIVGEYERLLGNGQATSTVRETLGDCVQSFRTLLASRFDDADHLLPQS